MTTFVLKLGSEAIPIDADLFARLSKRIQRADAHGGRRAYEHAPAQGEGRTAVGKEGLRSAAVNRIRFVQENID
jgi:hypothetical protein